MSDDRQALREIAAVSDGEAIHSILHYLYAPSSEAAGQIAKELRESGFKTEERLGGDDVNWLVLARHEAVPTDELMTSTRRSMEALTAKVGGEYDGWEADVRHPGGNTPSHHY